MVHASKNFLHVTWNKLRHRHHLALYSASCISMCNTLLVLRVFGVERPRRTLGVLVPISGGSRVLPQDHGSHVRSRAGRHHSNRQSANNLLFRKLHTTHVPNFAAHRRTAVGNQRTTCFSQIAHYTPAFVAAHRRRSLFTPAVRSSSKSQNWITHRPAALCSCHSLNPLQAFVLNKGQIQVQISPPKFLQQNP